METEKTLTLVPADEWSEKVALLKASGRKPESFTSEQITSMRALTAEQLRMALEAELIVRRTIMSKISDVMGKAFRRKAKEQAPRVDREALINHIGNEAYLKGTGWMKAMLQLSKDQLAAVKAENWLRLQVGRISSITKVNMAPEILEALGDSIINRSMDEKKRKAINDCMGVKEINEVGTKTLIEMTPEQIKLMFGQALTYSDFLSKILGI